MSFDKGNPEMLLLLETAVNRYGYNRTTGDLDIYLKDTEDNRQNLIYAFDKMGYGRYDMLLDVPIMQTIVKF